MQNYYREMLRNIPLVIYDGSYYNLRQLFLSVFKENYNNEFYYIVRNLNLRKKIIPDIKYYKNWFSIIVEENNQIQGVSIKRNVFIKSWGITMNEETGENEVNYIYDEEDLLKDLVYCKNINNLCNKTNKNKKEIIENTKKY